MAGGVNFMLSPRAPEEQGTAGKDQHFAQEGADEFSIAREGRYQRVDAKVRPFVAGNHGAQERQVDEGEARQLLRQDQTGIESVAKHDVAKHHANHGDQQDSKRCVDDVCNAGRDLSVTHRPLAVVEPVSDDTSGE